MRYLVTARIKPGKEEALNQILREGSFSGEDRLPENEYLRRIRKWPGNSRTVESNGLKFAIVPRHWPEEQAILGEVFRFAEGFRTRMRAAAAVTWNGTSPGRATIVIAPLSWKGSLPGKVSCSGLEVVSADRQNLIAPLLLKPTSARFDMFPAGI